MGFGGPPPILLQQEDVVKLTEKCGLSSTGSSSPVVTPLRTPEDLKSNILKAQAEAAALKVRNRPHTTGQKGREASAKTLIIQIIISDASVKLKFQERPYCQLLSPLMLLIALENLNKGFFFQEYKINKP